MLLVEHQPEEMREEVNVSAGEDVIALALFGLAHHALAEFVRAVGTSPEVDVVDVGEFCFSARLLLLGGGVEARATAVLLFGRVAEEVGGVHCVFIFGSATESPRTVAISMCRLLFPFRCFL